MAAQQLLAVEGGAKPFGFDPKVLSQGRAGFEIATRSMFCMSKPFGSR